MRGTGNGAIIPSLSPITHTLCARHSLSHAHTPGLAVFIERELDGHMQDAHHGGSQPRVEPPEALLPGDAGQRIESASVRLLEGQGTRGQEGRGRVRSGG